MTVLGVFLFNQIRTGGNRRYLELMEALAERGLKVLVIMNSFLDYRPVHFKKIELAAAYQYRRLPPASYLFKRAVKKNLPAVKNALGEWGGGDFIHIHGDTSLKAGVFLKKKLRLPLFYASRCNDVDRAKILRASGGVGWKERLFSMAYDPVNRSRERQIARYAEIVTFQNGADRDRFLERTRYKGRTLIIPGNIGLPRCTPEWKDKNTSSAVKNLVYAGSLSASKGLWELFRALGILKNRGYDFLRLKVLGRREQEDAARGLIKSLGIESQVSLEGYQDPFPYLARCDLLVYPTLYDAYPDTVLEALHSGCPAVAAKTGGVPELLQYPELLFEPGDIDGIADRIEKCVTDASFYDHIRKLCAERAEAHRFDWAGRFEEAMADYVK